MSEGKQLKSSADETQSNTTISNEADEALLDTANTEYVIRYNLFYADEPIAGRDIPTGHANITLIERDGTHDVILGGGNIGVNLGGENSNGVPAEGNAYSHFNPFDKNLDGIVGVESGWQGPGQAIYEQSVTPEQLKDVQDSISDLTEGLQTGLINYNVAASVIPLKDQHSCYSFTQDVFEIAGGEGRLIAQFSDAELDKIKTSLGETKEILIETVHGDIPEIPQKISEKIENTFEDAKDRAGEFVGKDDGTSSDANLDINGTENITEHAAFTPGSGVPIETAIEALAADQAVIEAAYTGGERSAIHAALSHPSAVQMYSNLHEHGVETVPAEISPDMSPEIRATELLIAGRTATLEAGLEIPEVENIDEKHSAHSEQLHQELEDAYEVTF